MINVFNITSNTLEGPVLVTGAGGCIGAWTLYLLNIAGIETIAFDLSNDKRRPLLLMQEQELEKVKWITGNIVNSENLDTLVNEHKIKSIIHLAALQVPFCAEDPINGAKVNVVGSVNVFESAKKFGINHISFASSVAAHGFLKDYEALETLYGAYKLCTENIAKVYWNDYNISSLCLRPGVVTGVGRDQGMTSKTTSVILAAVLGEKYTVPFTGKVSHLFAGEAASAFIHSASSKKEGAFSFDLNGPSVLVEDIISIIRKNIPKSDVSSEGKPLPFPGSLSDQPLRDHLFKQGIDYGSVEAEKAILETISSFKTLAQVNKVNKNTLS